MMEAAPSRPPFSVPSLDAERPSKGEDSAYPSQNGNAHNTTSLEPPFHCRPATSMAYSHAASSAPQASTAGADSGTPPDSRRPSGEKEMATQPGKQTLPSISEALGVDNQTAYQTPLMTQASSMLPMQPSLHKTLVPSSPKLNMRAAYAAEPPQPRTEAFGPSYARPSTPKYHTEAPRTVYSDVRPALHLSTAGPAPYHPAGPGSSFANSTTSSSPVYERSQATAPSHFTYGYTQYPPRYQPSASSSSGPLYQPSSVTTAPSWKSDSTSRHHERSYGESVKRHLDLYDLESGLNDITSTSSFLGDFAHRYSNLLHQSPRSGPQLSMLPGIIEIEDMISKSRAQTEALLKIRETVLTQQAAHDQEAEEQRQQKAHGISAEMAPPHSSGDSDDGKSSYSVSDPKKRRGRAAPPGRCHSCNRAETPEWRRGPDGARTLCNACGLHYAKLTRKQNNAGKPAAVNSSNLRPKEHLS